MNLINTSQIIVNKSKFFGYLFSVESLGDVGKIVDDVWRREKKFDHVCYGACFEGEEIFKNDSEVGSPGKILLNLLVRKSLNEHCLVVGRIFGGVKLGPAGVGRAFREAGENCIS